MPKKKTISFTFPFPNTLLRYRNITFQSITICLALSLFACAVDKRNQKDRGAAYRRIGEAYLAQGEFTSALREFFKAEKLYPQDPTLQNYLGLTYRGKKKIDTAIFHFKKALSIKPDYATAMNNLGEAYLVKQEWDAAISVFNRLENDILYATPQFSHFNMAWAYFNKKDYITAEKYYKRVVAYYESGFGKDFTYIKALRGLGRTQFKLGNPLAARATLEKVIRLAPDFVPTYLDLADVYESTGFKNKALDALNKVIETTPESPMAQEAAVKVRKLTSEFQP